jgi:cytochrome d ubiquinol oxidase subunit II
MSEATAVAAVLWVGATMYAVFAGADFGAGLWSLLAGGSDRGRRPRELIDWAIGPVWEANHVWLIFVIVVLWTSFSQAFEAIFSTLFIPLSLAALGIVLRGSGFAFQHTAAREKARTLSVTLFGVASVLTPFFMGTVVGAIAGGRVPVGNASGDRVTSWVNPLSLSIGALFVATSAYMAAVFLVSDARRAAAPDLQRYFSNRALLAGAVAGALAAVSLVALHSDASYVFERLTSEGLPLVVISALCGLAVLVLLHRDVRRGARALAIGAVAAVVWGWAVAQYPYLLPETLTMSQGAAPSAVLTGVLIVFGVAVLVVIPALVLLFTLVQRNLVEETSRPTSSLPGGEEGTSAPSSAT